MEVRERAMQRVHEEGAKYVWALVLAVVPIHWRGPGRPMPFCPLHTISAPYRPWPAIAIHMEACPHTRS